MFSSVKIMSEFWSSGCVLVIYLFKTQLTSGNERKGTIKLVLESFAIIRINITLISTMNTTKDKYRDISGTLTYWKGWIVPRSLCRRLTYSERCLCATKFSFVAWSVCVCVDMRAPKFFLKHSRDDLRRFFSCISKLNIQMIGTYTYVRTL